MSLAQPYLDAKDRLLALTDGISHETFNAKPGPKKWSAAECVTHLNTVSQRYLPVFEEAVTADGPRGEPPFRYGVIARAFIAAVTPGSRPIPTAPAMKPPASQSARSEIDLDRSLETFLADTARYVAVIEESEGLDLAAIKLRSPFLPLMKFPLGVYLEALGQHSLRHVMQAERAVAAARG